MRALIRLFQIFFRWITAQYREAAIAEVLEGQANTKFDSLVEPPLEDPIPFHHIGMTPGMAGMEPCSASEFLHITVGFDELELKDGTPAVGTTIGRAEQAL